MLFFFFHFFFIIIIFIVVDFIFLFFCFFLVCLLENLRLFFVHCTRQAGFGSFVKDEAEHMSAFLPVALRLCMTQSQSGPRGQRAEGRALLTNPQGEISAFLLRT